MIELYKLTRSFHDTAINEIKCLDETTIEFTIEVCEVGEEFGISGDHEAYWAYPEVFGNMDEYERVIRLTFYCVSNLNKQINFEQVKNLMLEIIEFKVKNNKNILFVCGSNNRNIYEEISFDAKGFDLKYLKDQEKRI